MIRKLVIDDYNQIIHLLKNINSETSISKSRFLEFFKQLGKNHQVYVLEEDGVLKACGTLLIEHKIIHNGGKVEHLEDIVVDIRYQKQGYGGKIIQFLVKVAQESCYKVILNCDTKISFLYQKYDFKNCGNEMAIYFNSDKKLDLKFASLHIL